MSIYCMCQSENSTGTFNAVYGFGKDKTYFQVRNPNIDHPMRCIKTGAPTEINGIEQPRNCDVYECQHCGARVAYI